MVVVISFIFHLNFCCKIFEMSELKTLKGKGKDQSVSKAFIILRLINYYDSLKYKTKRLENGKISYHK